MSVLPTLVNTIESTVAIAPPASVTSAQVVVPQPFQVVVDSPTDWVAVIAVPLALAIAAGIFTVFTNKQQIRANTANYRHTWQLNLREAIVDFLAATNQISIRCVNDRGFIAREDAEELRTRLFRAHWTVELMLDTNKQYATDLKSAMNAVLTNLLADEARPDDELGLAIQNVGKASQIALEQAWQDIRRDLKHNKPKKIT